MTDSNTSRGGSNGNHSFRLPRRVFVGSLISPQTLLSITMIQNAVIGVGNSGVIRFVEDLDEYKKQQQQSTQPQKEDGSSHEDDRSSTPVPIPSHDSTHNTSFLSEQVEADQAVLQGIVAKHGWNLNECELVQLSKDSFLCPGFIDTHTHAPQVPNLGLGQQYELLDWLQYVTFPREKKFEDVIYAQKTYESVVERMINSGTTCAAIYATLHEEATMILADICNQKGLRALVGKCQMDRNSPVDYMEKNPSASMEATRNFINYCRNMKPYGSKVMQSPGEEAISPSVSSATSSESPEMNNSIARLQATMNEMIDGDKAATSSSSSTSHEGGVEKSNGGILESASTKVSQTITSLTSIASKTSSEQQGKKPHSIHRNSSLSSSTSSLNGAGGRKATQSSSSSSHSRSNSNVNGMSNGGYDSPKRQKERDYSNALVQPILTPRFAISCSDALLTSIFAMMSRDPSLRIQTHLSENESEIDFTKKLFPFTSCYTQVYDHFSLLTPRTILAHAIHLDDDEMKLIGKRKCGISHCPTSNNNLRSGVSRVGEMLNRGIKVGLGTDMSGGFGLSILTAIREASVVAKVLNFKSLNSASSSHKEEGSEDHHHPPNNVEKQNGTQASPAVGSSHHNTRQVEKSGSELNMKRAQVENYDFCNGPLSVATLFYLATLGGAEVCNLAHRVGSLEVGKEFDALLINTANGCPNLYIEEDDQIEERLEKFLFCGDDRNIASVFVRGRIVGGSSPI